MEFLSEWKFDELPDADKKEMYGNLLKAYRREVRILDAVCLAAKAYPHHD